MNTFASFHLIPNFPQSITQLSPGFHHPSPVGLYLCGAGVGTGACIPPEPVLKGPILGGQSVAGAVFEGHILVLGSTTPPALFAPTPQGPSWLHVPSLGRAVACLPPSSPQYSSLSLSSCLSLRRLGQHAHPQLFIGISLSHDPPPLPHLICLGSKQV